MTSQAELERRLRQLEGRVTPPGSGASGASISAAVAAALAAGVWETPVLSANWSNTGGGFAPVGFFVEPDGWVSLRGVLQKSGAGVAYETIFTVPLAYAPAFAHTFATPQSGTTGVVEVTESGIVAWVSGNAASVSLSGIRWRANG